MLKINSCSCYLTPYPPLPSLTLPDPLPSQGQEVADMILEKASDAYDKEHQRGIFETIGSEITDIFWYGW